MNSEEELELDSSELGAVLQLPDGEDARLEQIANISFGKSEFRGQNKGFWLEVRRWLVQFVALSIKNWKVLFRQQSYVLLFLLLPSCVILTFLGERSYYTSGGEVEMNLQALDIESMLGCHTYHQAECVRIVYAPKRTEVDAVMEEVASMQGFTFGENVLGFDTNTEAKDYVGNNLGTVEFTVFFRDAGNPLWSNSVYDTTYPGGSSVSTNISSYVIFYNATLNREDGRSKMYDLNVQLLSLQKTIESAYLKQMYPSTYSEYILSYGQFWNSSMPLSTAKSTNYTAVQQATIDTNEFCLMGTIKNMSTVGYLLPWVASFSMIFMSVIAYRMLAEERHKDLFGFLRRIGLMDTAYHASWFMTFQVLQLMACGLAMVTMAIIRGQNDYYSPSLAIRKIDYGVMFLVLWLASTCFVSSAFFMASVSTSSNAANAIVFAQFLSAFLTIIACLTPLNQFVAEGYTGGNILNFDCFYVTSSWNTIYSEAGLPGASFVQFLIFFMPWFHLSQALTDMVSVVMYDSADMKVTLSSNFAEPPTRLSFSAAPGTDFKCGWIQQSLAYMIYSSIFFYFVCWFLYQAVNSDGSEGRPLLSILVPAFARQYFQKEEVVEEGDVRGDEKRKSAQEHSVRGYKISKSYFGGVQALKEVSFTMKKGEIFVLLGHNGAGKSSLINVITGLTASTRGKTFLNGLDIDEDMSDIQQSIGVCPQHDILWENLTAMDHMLLVAAFKGLSGNNLFSPLYMDASTDQAAAKSPLFKSIQNVLGQVQLLDRCKDFASTYSGGMRRRLSVALSTVGDVDVVILDEPTTGLDALSRRRVWETINKLKQDRVVLLTTHNMEEADALGDNIMVLHNGQVRAVGDSLTLKSLYGKGYQVQLEVRLMHMLEFFDLMKKMLPGSQCTNDAEVNPSLVTLSVARGDIRSLPRLFAWLEGSKHSTKFVKEWSVSNTTLEQVFLTLCTQNNAVNFVDATAELERRQLKLCPMCFTRPREAVVMREYRSGAAGGGQAVALPDSVCRVCAKSNRFYRMSEQDADRALADESGATMSSLVEGAQVAFNNEIEEEALMNYSVEEDPAHNPMNQPDVTEPAVSDPDPVPEPEEQPSPDQVQPAPVSTNDSTEADSIEMLTQPPADAAFHPLARRGFAKPVDNVTVTTLTREELEMAPTAGRSKKAMQVYAAAKYGPRFRGSAGSQRDQMFAIFIKNTRLQYKQSCSNCCSVCYVATMFLFLYVMSLLIAGSLSNFSQCEAGYLTTVGCGIDDLTKHLFYPSTTSIIVGQGTSDSDLGMTNGKDPSLNGDGYAVNTYLVPAEYGELTTPGAFTLNGVNMVDEVLPNAGLPLQLQGRPNIIWNSLLSTTNDDLIDSTTGTGFGFRSRAPPPSVTSGGTAAPNEVQYSSQEQANEALQDSSSPCWYYIDPSFDIGSTSTPEWRAVELFGASYSDVAIQCPSCVSSAVDVNTTYASIGSRTIAFNGTLWVGKNMNPTAVDSGYTGICQDFACFPYGFGFLNVQDSTTDSNTQYLYSETCPTGYGYYSKSPQIEAAQTQVAATFTNLLSNSLVDPLLRNYTIQGAYSPYGTLINNGYIISSTQSFFLIFFSMIIMNGFLHLSVWRHGHEASLELVELTRAMGLRPWVYILSMFAYDFAISFVTGEALIGFAVGLELLNFKDAPMGLLTAVVVCSAVAFNGATLVLAKLFHKVAGVMSLVTVCLTLVMAVTCTLLNVQLYTEEGSWPIELSIIPWLAQSRALYIILVYHRSSDEVDASLGLLFTFGFVCIGAAIIIAERDALKEALAEKASIDIYGRGDEDDMAAIKQGPEKSNAEAEDDTEAGERGSVAKVRRQLDVAAEKERARNYIAGLLTSALSGADSSPTHPLNPTAAGGSEEEGEGQADERLVTVIYNMRHKYVENSLSGLLGQLLTGSSARRNATSASSSTPHAEGEADAEKWAVRGLSLALSLGECFGLLGTNGAGKSTTISTLIGKIKATCGKQFVAGADLKHGLSSSVHQFIGICPQFDVTWPDLTVEEHLAFQARQRGISPPKIQAKVQQAAQWVHLDGDAYNTKAAGLSGGMRRRLSIAMALIGDPPIVLLDEPTTGLDPDNRQQVWKIIQSLRGPDRLILMTTHSMEEAEALCSRIGIVHKGTLRCIGTSQHLKAQFGKGFTLTVNSLSKDPAVLAAIDEYVIRDVARRKASLLSRINCTTRYLINKETDGVGVCEIFQKMEASKEALQIREWGLAMTTLEEVFISAVSD